jgi:hypothetical protein
VSAHDGSADTAATTAASSDIADIDRLPTARATAKRTCAALGCTQVAHLALPHKVI